MKAHRRRLLAALLTGAVVALCGCSGSGDSGDGDQESSSQQDSDGGGSSGDGSSAESVQNSATTPPDEALAGKKFTVKGTYEEQQLAMRFDLLELKRRGDLLQLVAHVTNTETDKSKDLRWQIGSDAFDSKVYRKDMSGSDDFAGIVLTDVTNKKRYLAAADSGGDCVCTGDLSGTFVGAGQTVELAATYAAPPDSVTELDVHVPTVGVFRDVPVS